MAHCLGELGLSLYQYTGPAPLSFAVDYSAMSFAVGHNASVIHC